MKETLSSGWVSVVNEPPPFRCSEGAILKFSIDISIYINVDPSAFSET